MSATVVNILDFLGQRRIDNSSNPAMRPEQQARARVTTELDDKVPHRILCEARSHAVRSVIAGLSVDVAVRRAVAWARCADHGGNGPDAA
jgi:hypothetical protein